MKIQAKLRDRQAILCFNQVPAQCVLCDSADLAVEIQSFMLINPEGEAGVCENRAHFCSACPAVYLENAPFQEVARSFEFDPFAVVGFLDLQALPPEKQGKPLEVGASGEIPLVEFASLDSMRSAQVDLNTLDQLAGLE